MAASVWEVNKAEIDRQGVPHLLLRFFTEWPEAGGKMCHRTVLSLQTAVFQCRTPRQLTIVNSNLDFQVHREYSCQSRKIAHLLFNNLFS